MAVLELARRARAAGSKSTGRWVYEEISRESWANGRTDLDETQWLKTEIDKKVAENAQKGWFFALVKGALMK